jgi:hypothetical protein
VNYIKKKTGLDLKCENESQQDFENIVSSWFELEDPYFKDYHTVTVIGTRLQTYLKVILFVAP